VIAADRQHAAGQLKTLALRWRHTATALGWVGALVLLPILLWHRVIGDVLGSFRWSLSYVAAELTPWFLLLCGIGFLLPVALSAGRDPESRLFPRARRSYFVWGIVLYLLGLVLVAELVEVWNYAH